MLQGLYPLSNWRHPLNINYLEDYSYLWGTSYGKIITGMTDTWTDDVQECSEFPIYQVPDKIDNLMSTANCGNVNKFLEDEAFKTKTLDESLEENSYKAFLSRMLMPMAEVLSKVISSREKKVVDHLKYLILNVHETNIANFLRFLGYWDAYGYDKFTRFSSSVRVELISRKERFWQIGYYIRVIYDDEVIKLPWCSNNGYLCPATEFIQYFENNLIQDKTFIDQYCEGTAGDVNYTQ